MGRRALLELLGGLAFLAACSETSTVTRATSSTSSGTARGSTGATSAPGSTGTTVEATTSKLAKGARSTADQLQTERDKINGIWRGSWRDDKDRGGNVDGIFDIDVAGRAIDFTLKIDGPFLGGPSAPTTTTYRVDADALSRNDDDVTLQSPLVGAFDLQFLGFGEFQLNASHIPGHDDITSLVIKGVWQDLASGSMTYEVKGSSSAAGRGTVAWTRRGPRAKAPKPGAIDDPTAFLNGDYAASLITVEEASRLLGQPCKEPEGNGGKSNFAPGLNISNARVETFADLLNGGPGAVIQYSVYRAGDAAAMQTFFRRYVGYRAVPNLGDEAVALPPGASFPIGTLDVRQGRDNLELSIVRGGGGPPLSKQQSDAIYLAIAKVILGRLH